MPERATVTYADLASFPDDNVRREIIDGELIETTAPYVRHQRVLQRLFVAFHQEIEARGGGEVFIAPVDVVFSDTNVTEPDLIFVSDDRRHIVTEKNIPASPDLLAEVASDTRMDRVRKRDVYARFGVPEYWIVDPEADRVEVLRLDGDVYAKPEIFEPGDVLTYARLPELRIGIAELFARRA